MPQCKGIANGAAFWIVNVLIIRDIIPPWAVGEKNPATICIGRASHTGSGVAGWGVLFCCDTGSLEEGVAECAPAIGSATKVGDAPLP